jgi:hypothetical protein
VPGTIKPPLSSETLEIDSVLPAPQQTGPNGSFQKNNPAKPNIPPSMGQVAESSAAYADQQVSPPFGGVDDGWDDMPPPPDNFPAGWDSEWQPSFENAELAARPEPVNRASQVRMAPKVDDKPVREPRALVSLPTRGIEKVSEVEVEHTRREQLEARHEALAVQHVEAISMKPAHIPPSIYVPLAQAEPDKEHPPQQITVLLRSTGDRERDKRRIRAIYGTLISFNGRDRFTFQIFENGKGHLIDFPNDTTQVCTKMLERLKKLLGEESWRVEEITFQ